MEEAAAAEQLSSDTVHCGEESASGAENQQGKGV